MLKGNKILFCCLIATFFIPVVTFAQLGMKLELDRKNYLQYETIYARVSLSNRSGHPLIFGSNPNLEGQLTFQIETPSGKKVKLVDEQYSSLAGRVVPPGRDETRVLPISKMYNLRAPGKYKLWAVVNHAQLPNSYRSNASDFKVTSGTKVWGSVVGVPTVGKLENGQKIKKRNYKILSFFDGADSVYCLLVEDDKYVYGVTRIGYDIGNSKPECEIDRFSKLHILVQSSPTVYTYYIYDTDCHLDLKEVYKKSKTVPRLVRNTDSGRVLVAGGTKAREGTDYIEEKDDVQ